MSGPICNIVITVEGCRTGDLVFRCCRLEDQVVYRTMFLWTNRPILKIKRRRLLYVWFFCSLPQKSTFENIHGNCMVTYIKRLHHIMYVKRKHPFVGIARITIVVRVVTL